jgi:hypothetical protein
LQQRPSTRTRSRIYVDPSDELVVVAPAVEQSRLDWLANDEDDARASAQAVGSRWPRRRPADASVVEVKPDAPQQVVRGRRRRASPRPHRRGRAARRGRELARGRRQDSGDDRRVPIALVVLDS